MSTAKKTRDWYKKHASEYAAHVRNKSESIYHSYYEKPAIRGELPGINGKATLSLGCGSGEDAQYLKTKGALRSVGVDITQELIDIAKRNYPDCEFRVMDIESLDFSDNTFDLAYSSLVMHYLIGGAQKALEEAFRVLKSGGTLLFSDGHPIGSSMQVIRDDQQIIDKKLSIKRDKVNNTEEDFGDYLTSRVMESESDWDVEYWHQPLGLTINQIIEAGFVLDKVVEFKPKPEMERVNPRVYNRLVHIPEMILFKAHKPVELH